MNPGKHPRSPFVIGGLALSLALVTCAPSARANVYATNIKLNGSTNNLTVPPGTNIAVSYILNELASAGVTVKILSGAAVIRTISVAGGTAGTTRGTNSVIWDGKDNSSNNVPGGNYSLSVTAASTGYSGWTQTTSDTNSGNQVWKPRGIAVNYNSNSFYYGRVFVGNSESGPTTNSADLLGIQKLNADGSPAEEGTFSDGGATWAGGSYAPWKVRVGADDRVYVEDFSGFGVIYSWDQQITSATGLNVMRDDNNPGGFLSGFCITGTGASRQVWMADNASSGYGILRWNAQADGTLATNDTGTQIVQAGSSAGLEDSAYDVAVDKGGDIYIASQPSAPSQFKILRFPPYAGAIETAADWRVDNTSSTLNLSGIAVDPSGTYVAVALAVSMRVDIYYATNGAYVATVSTNVAHPQYDVAWDNVGNLYNVFDVGNGVDSHWRAWSPPGANAATTLALETIQVTVPAAPQISKIGVSGATVAINFTGSTNDTAPAFTLLSAAAVNGPYQPAAGASISLVNPGLFLATVPTNGPNRFYRIQR